MQPANLATKSSIKSLLRVAQVINCHRFTSTLRSTADFTFDEGRDEVVPNLERMLLSVARNYPDGYQACEPGAPLEDHLTAWSVILTELAVAITDGPVIVPPFKLTDDSIAFTVFYRYLNFTEITVLESVLNNYTQGIGYQCRRQFDFLSTISLVVESLYTLRYGSGSEHYDRVIAVVLDDDNYAKRAYLPELLAHDVHRIRNKLPDYIVFDSLEPEVRCIFPGSTDSALEGERDDNIKVWKLS